MKKIYSFLFVGILLSFTTNAQIDIAIGTGTVGNGGTTYPAPLQDFYEGCRMQYLYTAAELQSAGMAPGIISGIKFEVTALNGTTIIEQMKIGIDGTTTSSLGSTTWETVNNNVYGPIDYQPVIGFNTFNFSTPFVWNGSDNIVIEICNGDPNNAASVTYTNNATTPWTVGLTFNGSHNYRADNLGNLCGSSTTANTGLQTSRPNITFQWIPGTPCSGVPTAGVAAASDTVVCATQNFTLSLTGSTVASGISIQWQSSPDNVTFTNIAGGTFRNFVTSQMATSYYRAIVKCANDSVFSNTINITSPALIPANTFTINSALPTSGANFNNFTDAFNYIKCGISGPVIFNVAPGSGPYTEQVSIPAIPNTSATNSVSVNGNGATINFGSVDANNRHVIQFNGSKYVYLRDLIIDATGSGATYGWGIHLTKNAAYDSIVNCTINTDVTSTSTNFAGIVISGSNTSATTSDNSANNIVIRGNTINGGYYSINNYGNSTVPYAENVQILNNSLNDFYYYGVNLSGTNNNIVAGNTIQRLNRTTVGFTYGIYVGTTALSTAILGNKVTNLFDQATSSTSTVYAIYLAGDGTPTAPALVVNNLVADINHNGTIYGIYNTGAANMLAYHNTISLDNQSATAGTTYGFYQTTSDTGMVFSNNLITIGRGGSGLKYGIYKATTATPLVSNFNDIYLYSSGSGLQYYGYQNTGAVTLAAWQALSGQDLSSLSIDPVYAAMSSDYTPTASSLNDRGKALGVLYDITGAPRNSLKPDIGAYEFTVPACTAPPTAGDATAASTTVCQNAPIALSLLNNSSGLTQTYQWQYSNSASGPWTSIGNLLSAPDTLIIATTTLFYRAAVTCGTSTAFSTPIEIIVSPALPAGNYTLNSSLPTSATNFQSFADAILALKCGIAGAVTINVDAASSFTEQVTIPVIPGTSPGSRVTINGNGATLQFGSSDINARHVLQLNGADYITIKNLNVVASGGTYGWGIHMTAQADNDSIVNCSIVTDGSSTSTSYAGIVISGANNSATTSGNNANNAVIMGNTITGGYYGIINYGNAGTPVTSNNQIIGNSINDFYYYGIYSYGSVNTNISKNTIQRLTRTTVGFTYGVYITGTNYGLLMDKNRVTKLFDAAPASTSTCYGIYVAGDGTLNSPLIISNNLVGDFIHNGTIYGLYNAGAMHSKFYHNTVVVQNVNATAGATYGYYQSLADTGVAVRNNIIDINRGGTSDKYGFYYSANDTIITSNNNNVVVNGSGGNQAVGYYNLTPRITMADWQAASGEDANSLSFDPAYVSQGPDYVPTNAVLNDRGAPVGVLTDITDAARSATTPDIGAFEFAVAACTAPPIAGSTAANDSLVCAGSNVALSLVGNSYGLTQTYRWETSSSASGPWTPIGFSLSFPDSTVIVSNTTFFRAAVTCGASTTYSTPLQIVVKPILAGGTYTINAALPTGGTNFQTMADAMSAIECGVSGPIVFNIAPGSGPYYEQLALRNINGTSATNTITFNGNGATIAYPSTDANNRAAIKLDGVDFVTIKNFNIDLTGGTYGWGIHLYNQADNDSIVNCTINCDLTSTLTNYAGIVISGSPSSATTSGNNANNLVIYGNNINGGYYGIINYGNSSLPATSNVKIINNNLIDFNTYGIYTAYSSNPVISGNVIQRPTRTSVSTAYGIYATAGTIGGVIEKNKVSALFDGLTTSTSSAYGIYLVSDAVATAENKVYNNLVYGFNHEGSVYGLYNGGSRYSSFYHNTVSIDNAGATAGTTYGYYQSSSDTSIMVMNNLITIQRGGSGVKYGMYISSTSTPPVMSNYNNIYLNSAGTGTQNFGYFGVAVSTLTDWRLATSQDINSVAIDPVYTSASGGDFLPTATAMDNLGTPVGVSVDIRDTIRSNVSPDMGAYEFGQRIVPVTLKSIRASLMQENALVTWSTAAEVNFSHFVVERAIAGMNFESIGTVRGNAAGSLYSYKDVGIVNQVKQGTILYYRLKMVDIDGRYKYSPVVNVRTDRQGSMVTVYPNPVKEQMNIIIKSAERALGNVTITDLAGRIVYRKSINVSEGENLISLNDVGQIAKGVYVVKLHVGTHHSIIEIVKD